MFCVLCSCFTNCVLLLRRNCFKFARPTMAIWWSVGLTNWGNIKNTKNSWKESQHFVFVACNQRNRFGGEGGILTTQRREADFIAFSCAYYRERRKSRPQLACELLWGQYRGGREEAPSLSFSCLYSRDRQEVSLSLPEVVHIEKWPKS